MITDTFARARGCVHVFDFCHDWTMASKACKFASVRRSLNLEHSLNLIWHASMPNAKLTVALTGAADMFVNWRARR